MCLGRPRGYLIKIYTSEDIIFSFIYACFKHHFGSYNLMVDVHVMVKRECISIAQCFVFHF